MRTFKDKFQAKIDAGKMTRAEVAVLAALPKYRDRLAGTMDDVKEKNDA